MNIDAAQFRRIVTTAYDRFEPDAQLSSAEAELVVAIAQLAVAADRFEDPEERALLERLSAHIYATANLATSPPDYAPVDDDAQRLDHLRNHAAQLRGKGAGALAYAVAYVLLVADLDLAPEEGDALEALREALDLDAEASDEMIAEVSEIVTPPE